MKRILLILSLPLVLTACSTLESLNPFASSGPKMAELQPIKATATVNAVWRESVGKSGLYTFTPAVVRSTVYTAANNGDVVRIDDGKAVWKINVGQSLSGGVAATDRLVVVGSPKGDVLAFDSSDGKLRWKAKATSEILSPAAIGEGLVIVVLVVEEKSGELTFGPNILSKGFVFEQHYSHVLEDAKCIVLDIFENVPPGQSDLLTERIRSALRRFFRKVLERDPVVVPLVITL